MLRLAVNTEHLRNKTEKKKGMIWANFIGTRKSQPIIGNLKFKNSYIEGNGRLFPLDKKNSKSKPTRDIVAHSFRSKIAWIIKIEENKNASRKNSPPKG